ncbi:5'-3' exoribonuclease 2-like isoform X1 [Convolutriloba macropyga]|uniref:5'-3' exoribonuclease 2-like isoform X1 n=2 Tax=Convolutriloba macropyga TaxID=536237 RepID=UPI003F526F7E
MGVPAFFRWLSRKYPSLIVDCVEEKPRNAKGERIPVDIREANPNNTEFDNLYLDMNGIIHPCCHPEDKAPPKDEDEMMVRIFEAIDRLMAIVRPRKLLYMAIDGPAPRAKMNQQRSRRFRASKESGELKALKEKIRSELAAKGIVIEEKKKSGHFDSNCITPGTEFMDRLAVCLRYYVHDRMETDPGWAKIQVVLSDAQVPGEGEHKIMDYIRRQRAQPDHDPNTHHCLCGADADLIMLGLATHEPHFTIIREEFKPNKPRPCELCGQVGHELKECDGSPPDQDAEPEEASEVNFIFVRLNVLRECLEKELVNHSLPFKWDLERAIDDWVFMCFFVGNDFLPHLPSLEIREGAIDRLIRIYHNVIYETKGWLSDNGYANLYRVQLIMKALGEMEDEIFKKRAEREKFFKEKEKRQKAEQAAAKSGRGGFSPAYHLRGQLGPQPINKGGRGGHSDPVVNPRQAIAEARMQSMQHEQRQFMANKKEQDMNNRFGGPENRGAKRTREQAEQEDSEDENDEVKLHQDGWKDRYYSTKFHVPASDIQFRKTLGHAYVLGLCWVLRYYYQGCPSWKWFYPFHYAPFASDFIDIVKVDNSFDIGKPFQPLEQLMGVFPAASGNFLPASWRRLMSKADSPIIDMYPTDFKIDLNGKKFAWQGVALLPFVDERRLLATLDTVYPDLSQDETRRNTYGCDNIFFSQYHPAYNFIKGIYEGFNPRRADKDKQHVSLDPKFCYGMACTVWPDPKYTPVDATFESPIPELPDLNHNKVLQICFQDPYFPPSHIYKATILPGCKMPEKVLKPGDWDNKRDGQFRPMIGFNRNMPRASLDQAGHRMLRAEGVGGFHNNDRGGRGRGGGGGNFRNEGVAIAPPSSYGNSGGYRGGRHSWDGSNFNNQQFNRGGGRGGGFNRGGGGGGYNGQQYDNRGSQSGNFNRGTNSFGRPTKRTYGESSEGGDSGFSDASSSGGGASQNPFKKQRISHSNSFSNTTNNSQRGGGGGGFTRGNRQGFGWGSY